MPWSDSYLDECARTLEARMKARQDAAEERAERLRGQATEGARRLLAEFGATRAWLFGSLAWGRPHEDSDVDLLVEGLDRTRHAAAERMLEDLVEARVDLVRMEDAPPGLAERVLADGRQLR